MVSFFLVLKGVYFLSDTLTFLFQGLRPVRIKDEEETVEKKKCFEIVTQLLLIGNN